MAKKTIWITSALRDDPRVERIATTLVGSSQDALARAFAVGALVSMWAKAAESGERVGLHWLVTGLDLKQLDADCGRPGFGQAVVAEGIVEVADNGLLFLDVFGDLNTPLVAFVDPELEGD